MTTSPAHFNSPARCIEYAMQNAGLLEEGDTPNSEQIASNMNRLNDLLYFMQTSGLKLWLQQDTTVPLTASINSYSLGPSGSVTMTKPIRVNQGYYQNNSDPTNPVRMPLSVLSWNEWLTLSTYLNTGPITQFFVDKQQTQLNVKFWLTPDATTAANGDAHLLVQQQVTGVVSLADSMNFPPEWFIALYWGLASEICTGQSQEIVSRCEQKSMLYRNALEDFDREDTSVYMKPDYRGQSFSRFR